MTRPRWIFVGLAVAALALGGCGSQATAEPATEAITIEEVEDSGFKILTLSEKAAERLGLETVTVAGGTSGMTIPYAAIVYDADGKTWAYVNSEGLTYMRAAVTVDEIDGDVARLSEGPPEGTPVVTTGAAELYGAEIGVGGGH